MTRQERDVRVTLAHVARAAGVSVATASRALRGDGRMRDETRERVTVAADRLGFQPNQAARALLTGRTWTVGLLTTDGIGRFSTPVLLGAEDALGAGRISVLLCDTRGDAEREQRQVATLLARQVDGIIVTGRRTDPRPPLAGLRGVPTVYALAPSTDPADLSVGTDDAGGARLAVDHLLGGGRRRIAHVTGPAHHAAARLRAAATRQRLAEAGLGLAGPGALHGDWSEAWGRDATRALLAAAPDTDAFFCGSDQLARGVTDALRELGRRVPDDIAVVGYDNWETMALAARPPLTTVDLDLPEVGRRAALRLLGAIDGRPAPGVEFVPCALVVRRSA
jgi:LacI family transcriptional regulator